uniref:Uncharacterized protein n=1 Tax=Romanomermis culicivorax TaxID=13658 RepID=A0A915K1R9_ROMCU
MDSAENRERIYNFGVKETKFSWNAFPNVVTLLKIEKTDSKSVLAKSSALDAIEEAFKSSPNVKKCSKEQLYDNWRNLKAANGSFILAFSDGTERDAIEGPNEMEIAFDSFRGSERGVDVPVDRNHPIQVSQSRPRSPPPYNSPRLMHKRQSVTMPITPTRFPAQSRSNPSESCGEKLIPLTPVMTRRPPPPPYEKIGDCVKRDSLIFVPQQTSTPTSSGYRETALSNFHPSDSSVFNPGNNSIESDEILTGEKLSAPIVVDHRATAKSRKNVPSYYENIITATRDDDEENVHRLNNRDLTTTASSDVIPDSSRSDAENTVWYEYGCV